MGNDETTDDYEHQHGIASGSYEMAPKAFLHIGYRGEMTEHDGPSQPASQSFNRGKFFHGFLRGSAFQEVYQYLFSEIAYFRNE
jgi:hypothetical protein